MKNNKYREYSQKFIAARQNPQFSTVSRNYANIKVKSHVTSELKKDINNQVAYMKKINLRLQKSLSQKKNQLNYVQSVRNRYISQSLQKDFINDLKSKELQRLKAKTSQNKYKNMMRIEEAKNRILEKKQSSSKNLKNDLRKLKQVKELRQSQIRELNESRVQEIYEQKQKTTDSCKRFYQNRNKKMMESYKSLSRNEERKIKKQENQVKDLEKKLLQMNKKAQQKKSILQELSESIVTAREAQTSKMSRVNSVTSRSATPQIFKKTQITTTRDNGSRLN